MLLKMMTARNLWVMNKSSDRFGLGSSRLVVQVSGGALTRSSSVTPGKVRINPTSSGTNRVDTSVTQGSEPCFFLIRSNFGSASERKAHQPRQIFDVENACAIGSKAGAVQCG